MPATHTIRASSSRRLTCFIILLATWLHAGPATAAEVPAAHEKSARIESILFEGNSRTQTGRAVEATGLRIGDTADPETIHAALERLLDSGLFRAADVSTRRGSPPAGLIIVFHVQENRPQLRLGAGYEDLTGWYLIPAELAFDNQLGRGERAAIGARLGYRVGGLFGAIRTTPRRPSGWQLELRGDLLGEDRVYFLDETETAHHIDRRAVLVGARRGIGGPLRLDLWAGLDRIDADSTANVYQRNETRDRDRGDEIPFEGLPILIQDDVGRRSLARVGFALSADARRGAEIRRRGIWGRADVEYATSGRGDFASAGLDTRAYLPVGERLQLAARVRGAAVSAKAPFYERLYLGGIYTVRGYPSQSISPPEGNLNLAVASIELRRAVIGPANRPLLAAIAFIDGGIGGNHGLARAAQSAAGVGFGYRLRVPWVGYLGVDAAHPLSTSPVDDAFHLNVSLGWAF